MQLYLKEIRTSRTQYTQTDIAKTAGVDIKTVGNWEKGKTYPNARQLVDICNLLNCSPNEILGYDGPDYPPRPKPSPLDAAYRSASPRAQRAMEEIVGSIAELDGE